MSTPLVRTELSRNYSGLSAVSGRPIGYQITRAYGLSLLFGLIPVIRATVPYTLGKFTIEAKKKRAKKVRIVNAVESDKIWALPPFTWIVTPVITEVSGEIFR